MKRQVTEKFVERSAIKAYIQIQVTNFFPNTSLNPKPHFSIVIIDVNYQRVCSFFLDTNGKFMPTRNVSFIQLNIVRNRLNPRA